MMTSLVYCVRTATTAPSSNPTKMPETTTRLRKVSTMTPMISPVVHSDARRKARVARKNPMRTLSGITGGW